MSPWSVESPYVELDSSSSVATAQIFCNKKQKRTNGHHIMYASHWKMSRYLVLDMWENQCSARIFHTDAYVDLPSMYSPLVA